MPFPIENIDKLCKENKTDFKNLEIALGFSNSTIKRWGNAKKLPPYERVKAVADYFNVSVYELSNGLMSSNEKPPQSDLKSPTVAADIASFPILGEIAAGYEHIAYESWDNGNIDIPESWLKGKSKEAYFVVKVVGDSMHPDYQDGDLVLVLKQDDVDYSGQVAIALYDDECATLKRVIFSPDKTWYRFQPINPQYGSVLKRGEELNHCKILGVPKKLIRNIEE